MNKIIKILLALFGGVEAVVYTITPIILVLIYGKVFGFQDWGSYLFYSIGLIASLFRAVKIGGWIKW